MFVSEYNAVFRFLKMGEISVFATTWNFLTKNEWGLVFWLFNYSESDGKFQCIRAYHTHS